jgi:hypothetical protein
MRNLPSMLALVFLVISGRVLHAAVAAAGVAGGGDGGGKGATVTTTTTYSIRSALWGNLNVTDFKELAATPVKPVKPPQQVVLAVRMPPPTTMPLRTKGSGSGSDGGGSNVESSKKGAGT